jgi:hypothetical protein
MLQAFTRPDIPAGTWAWLIHRYRTDEFSPYHDVKGQHARKLRLAA